MSLVTLTGTFVDPSGTAHTGYVLAVRADKARAGSGVATGSSYKSLVSGALPSSGSGALKVTAPSSGSYSYEITERFNDCVDASYLITVSSTDTTIDLSTKG